ncbi:hypothetical protein BGLT_02226 [Caballeronia glathei]|uniref:DUF7696 family protein n=1 Tax=Caballeronia glathei TaxID=60547 RepID=UPI0005021174|nr:hypothetical protein BGLT_02226 [Caballeronia glathei]
MTPEQAAEVVAEIAEWPLPERRAYIKQIREAFGDAAAKQIEAGLTELWNRR